MVNNYLFILIEAVSFISVFAGIAAAIIMLRINKRFGTGILASGFKTVALGIGLIAIGIIFDAFQVYFQTIFNLSYSPFFIAVKEILFLLGTYTIVIGSKKTGDNLESLVN
ncbi:MAG: hypothetical protein HYT08_04055 [Candidatus Levybacteria bacterium]|nr:hypothetical protein [Candidatus Levybacteria bacterium]